MTATMYGIFDWAGNRLFDGKEWPNAETAWEVVYTYAREKLGKDCSDKDFDEFVGEYYVDPLGS